MLLWNLIELNILVEERVNECFLAACHGAVFRTFLVFFLFFIRVLDRSVCIWVWVIGVWIRLSDSINTELDVFLDILESIRMLIKTVVPTTSEADPGESFDYGPSEVGKEGCDLNVDPCLAVAVL